MNLILRHTSGPQSLVMLPAKMADRIMLPDKVTEMENSIGYHTSINQSEESISIRCIIILNIHHTRIRLGCSKLKSDLHFNLFCGRYDHFYTCDRVIEDAYHYVFICPNYNDQRLVLLNSVSQITEPRLSYLLRGNYELSVNDNDKLFKHVQTFIQETTRFN